MNVVKDRISYKMNIDKCRPSGYAIRIWLTDKFERIKKKRLEICKEGDDDILTMNFRPTQRVVREIDALKLKMENFYKEKNLPINMKLSERFIENYGGVDKMNSSGLLIEANRIKDEDVRYRANLSASSCPIWKEFYKGWKEFYKM